MSFHMVFMMCMGMAFITGINFMAWIVALAKGNRTMTILGIVIVLCCLGVTVSLVKVLFHVAEGS